MNALLLLIAIVPHETIASERVDLIEVNHFFDGCGRQAFDQAIFWDWCPGDCRFHVRDWRMLKKPSQCPRFDHGTEDAFMLWQDGEVLREVRANNYRESWTQHDPELDERRIIPQERRRGLKQRFP